MNFSLCCAFLEACFELNFDGERLVLETSLLLKLQLQVYSILLPFSYVWVHVRFVQLT